MSAKKWPLRIIISGILACGSLSVQAHAAHWINARQAVTADAAKQPISLRFKRNLLLSKVPPRLIVHISADQRFVLYVNGIRTVAGPARGDLREWRFEAVDIAPYLKRGENVVTALVWSDGAAVPLMQMSEIATAPVAQISSGTTAFYLAAEDPAFASLLDSGRDWLVQVDHSRTAKPGIIQLNQLMGPTYYVGGNPEIIDGRFLTRSRPPQASDAEWLPADIAFATSPPWQLVRNSLPRQRYERVGSGTVVRQRGVRGNGFPARPITVAAQSSATILMDAGQVMAAYPVLRTTGGRGSEISVSYVEALYDPQGKGKGDIGSWQRFRDRAQVADGLALGLTDIFKPAGGDQSFAPYWWRVWRFAEIKIKTAEEPLTLDGFDAYRTGYPFQTRGRFISDDPELNEIWSIGWRTVQLGAHETFMDTAYWEQLQYVGDTRIQALISYDVAGDPRLAVQALDAIDSSRQVEGLPQAAWPQSSKNLIPPFSLLWIGMLHDYWMRVPDTEPLKRNLEGMRSVLDWYKPYLRENGILRPTPGWPFVDWRPGLNGMDRKDGAGPDSCTITIQYYGALRQAADLEGALGSKVKQTEDQHQADIVRQRLDEHCFDEARGLYADTPEKREFSQHANAMAVLYDLVPRDRQKAVLDQVTLPNGGIDAPQGIVGTTYYFSYYLAEALNHAGQGNRYHGLLTTWRRLLRQNFTTWPEAPDPVRSDSHAWSAHPTSGLLTDVAGIRPSAAGFATARIAPNLGHLKMLDATMAHPSGLIKTRYRVRDGRLEARVTLPKGVTGTFEWNGEVRDLRSGTSSLSFGLHTH